MDMSKYSLKLLLGTVLLLCFCLVGEAVAPSLHPHRNDEQDSTSRGVPAAYASRKVMNNKPSGEGWDLSIGGILRYFNGESLEAAGEGRRQLSASADKSLGAYGSLDPHVPACSTRKYSSCIVPTPEPRRPCLPYQRCYSPRTPPRD